MVESMSNLGEASALAHLLADAGIQFKVLQLSFKANDSNGGSDQHIQNSWSMEWKLAKLKVSGRHQGSHEVGRSCYPRPSPRDANLIPMPVVLKQNGP
ncbi:hypothetical protein MRB53_003447 [Persea americana]|uniref:Uncharacterized protein n=1 Tax=Persea americana TaxID=3435 RepID=A0ACC2MXM2_PERAE|nr:hypothetical protein MRB53_003447 [Persea americana]